MIYSSRGYRSKFGPVELGADEDHEVMALTVLKSEFADKAPPSARLNAGPTWHDVQDDFTLRYEGHVVGNIRLATDAASSASLWEWQITVPMMVPDWARGSAGCYEMCFEAFAAAFGRFLVETSPERLVRAWELERAAMARRGNLSTERPPARTIVELEDAERKVTIALPEDDLLSAVDRAFNKLTKNDSV
jgi:hypothetical protein